MTQVQGILVDPLGKGIPKATIRFTATHSVGSTPRGSTATHITKLDGSYDFNLEYGYYWLECMEKDEYVLTGFIICDEATPNPLSLNELKDYSPEVVPPVVMPDVPAWDVIHEDLRMDVDTGIRNKVDALADPTAHVVETKQILGNERLGAEMSEHTLSVAVGSTTQTNQLNTYEDKYLNQSIQHNYVGNTKDGSISVSNEIYDASNGEVHAHVSKELTTTDTSYLDSVEVGKEAIHQEVFSKGTKYSNTRDVLDEDRFQSNATTLVGAATEQSYSELAERYWDNTGVLVEAPRATHEHTVSIGSSTVSTGHEVLKDKHDEVYGSFFKKVTTYTKTAYEKFINDGFLSKIIKSADRYIVADSKETPVLEVNTVDKSVRVAGRLIIENPEDFQGPSGDSVFLVYQYSKDNGISDTWHDEFDPTHGDSWRRHATSTNGSVGVWSAGYQITAEDGHAGDTLYFEYQYSPDKATWHYQFEDGDIWRRERIIENGVPTSSWSEPARIKGSDGADGEITEIRYQYSVDGFEPWHANFSTGDHWRRERVEYFYTVEDRDNKNPYKVTPWSDAAKLVPVEGEDYGYKNATVFLYQKSNTRPQDPSAVVTYNLRTLTFTGLTNGWVDAIPDGETDVWVAAASIWTLGETDTIAPNEWVIEKLSAGGYQSAFVQLYKLGSTAPAIPNGPVVYDFVKGNVSGSLNGWSKTVPSNTAEGGRVWVTFNTAFAKVGNATDTLDVADWSAPAVLSQNGTNGSNGANGTPGLHGQGSFRKYVTTVPALNAMDADVLAIAKRPAQDGDQINYYKNDGAKETQFSRFFMRGVSSWTEAAFVVNGSAVIDGTLSAQKLIAASITGDKISAYDTIIAGSGSTSAGLNGNDSSGSNVNWRIWSGAVSAPSAPFRVDKSGNMFAYNAWLNGRLTLANSAYIDGTPGQNFLRSQNGSFVVDANGNFNANAGVMSNVTMNSCTIREDCVVKGTVYAEKIVGDVIKAYKTPVSIPAHPRARQLFIPTVPVRVKVTSSAGSGQQSASDSTWVAVNGTKVLELAASATASSGATSSDVNVGYVSYTIPANTSISITTYQNRIYECLVYQI